MATVIPPGVKIALDGTLGAAFLGHFVTTILFGITSLQAYIYYRDQTKDSWILRYSVLALWLLDGLHCGLITAALYGYCITNFMNLAAIQKPVWPIAAMIIVSNVSNSIVRGVFGYRIYKLGKGSWIIPIILFVMSTYIVVDGAIFAVRLLHVASYADVQQFSWDLYAGLSVEATVDLIVAVAQVMLLRSRRTGIRSTDSMLQVLMAYSVNTGLLTGVCAICAVITYATLPTKFVYFAFYFILSKLYVNSLLATLNARGSLLGGRSGRVHEIKASFHGFSSASTDRSRNQGIELMTVTSVDGLGVSSESTAEVMKADKESYP